MDDRGFCYPRACRGFTLVEVLISITLFALAMTLLLSGFRFTQKAWDAGERVTRRSADLEVVHRMLTNMLDRFVPLPVGDPIVYAFRGDVTSLRFAAGLPPYPVAGGVHRLEFAIDDSAAGARLTLRISAFDAENFFAAETEGEEETVLELADAGFSFGYAGPGEDGLAGDDAWEWHASWPEQQPPPQRVRLQIEQKGRYWPPIEVRVGSDMDLGCLPVDIATLCRLSL